MMNLRELIDALNTCEETFDDLDVRVQVDEENDGVILPVQEVSLGVDGRVYIRCFRT